MNNMILPSTRAPELCETNITPDYRGCGHRTDLHQDPTIRRLPIIVP